MVANTSQSPNISLIIVLLVLDDLRREVKRRSDSTVKPGISLQYLGNSQVAKLLMTCYTYNLDCPSMKMLSVFTSRWIILLLCRYSKAFSNCFAISQIYASEKLSLLIFLRLRICDRSRGYLMKVSFVGVLHDDVHIPFICKELVQFYDVFMVYPPEDLHLRTRLFRISPLNKMYRYLD